ncbi:hypothetical protein B0H14DRAFT_3859154 [Mycena olivaceomarginata]|nr:hypothetical protein B0H14DRAFT_3859154 [Mycena olivaceomarginata]
MFTQPRSRAPPTLKHADIAPPSSPRASNPTRLHETPRTPLRPRRRAGHLRAYFADALTLRPYYPCPLPAAPHAALHPPARCTSSPPAALRPLRTPIASFCASVRLARQRRRLRARLLCHLVMSPPVPPLRSRS